MEEVIIKYDAAISAIRQLSVSLKKYKINVDSLDYEQYRDSVIKRFEFTIDTLQKFLKSYLVSKHGLSEDIMSPRNIFRLSLETKIILDDQFLALIRAIEDRNRTSHTYDEELAEAIAQRIYDHERIIRSVLDCFEQQTDKIVFRIQSQ